MQKGTLRVYGCGGCGTEIAKFFQNADPQEGLAHIEVCYVDTSRSNLGDEIPDDQFVMVNDDKDGSGKIRRANASDISSIVATIPTRFKPADINVVVFSGAGGSGSVIGPLVTAELLKHDKPVICAVVGSEESLLDIQNTINTIMSLDGLSRKTSKVPFVMAYEHNGNGQYTDQADANIRTAISQLAVLASLQHRGLDTADLNVWANYHKSPMCNVEPQLSLLTIVNSVERIEKEVPHPISIATVSQAKTSVGTIGADYNCYGLLTTALPANVTELHYVINVSSLPDLLKMLTTAQARLEEKKASRPAPKSIIAQASTAEDNGMVFD